MKTTTIVSLFFVGLSLGSPINFEAREPEAVAELEARQFTGTGVTANELKNGPCKPVTYIFARGSTELGNLVSVNIYQEKPTAAGPTSQRFHLYGTAESQQKY